MTWIVLRNLGQAGEPLTTRTIVLELLVKLALVKTDQRLLRLMTKRIGVVFRLKREKDVLRAEQYMVWKIAR